MSGSTGDPAALHRKARKLAGDAPSAASRSSAPVPSSSTSMLGLSSQACRKAGGSPLCNRTPRPCLPRVVDLRVRPGPNEPEP